MHITDNTYTETDKIQTIHTQQNTCTETHKIHTHKTHIQYTQHIYTIHTPHTLVWVSLVNMKQSSEYRPHVFQFSLARNPGMPSVRFVFSLHTSHTCSLISKHMRTFGLQ